MKLWSLIVISPDSPNIHKIQFSRQAVVILIIAFLVSFCVTVAFARRIEGRKMAGVEFTHLEYENETMRVENKNLDFRTKRLAADLAGIERRAGYVAALIEPE